MAERRTEGEMPLEAGVKGRADTTAAILALEEIMKEETSGDKTLTVEELRNKLNRQYSRLFGNTKEISKKAVGTMLQSREYNQAFPWTRQDAVETYWGNGFKPRRICDKAYIVQCFEELGLDGEECYRKSVERH